MNYKIRQGIETLERIFGGKFYFIESKDYDGYKIDYKKYMVTIKRTNHYEYAGKYGHYFLDFNTYKEFYDYIEKLEERYKELNINKFRN